MNEYDIKRLALVLAVQAEIEGMKAYNADRLICGYSMGYNERAFMDMAEQLRDLATKHNEQL